MASEFESPSESIVDNDGRDSIDESASFLTTKESISRRRRGFWWSAYGLTQWLQILLISLLVLVVILQYARINALKGSSSYENGFRTDFVLAKHVIDTEEVAFTGGLVYDENGTLYREMDYTQPQYAGQPGPDIDKAWEDLMYGLEVVLEGDEAVEAELLGKTIEEPDGHSFRMSVDVYHSLHCVNLVRQALDVDYYHRNGEGSRIYRIHTDHCLDYLRQSIQCAGDLTPLYYQYSEHRRRGFPVWGSKHTCRNFGKIQHWALSKHRDQVELEDQHREHGN